MSGKTMSGKSQYDLLVANSYHAVPLNRTHPVGHHKIVEVQKKCYLPMKK